LLVSPYHPLRAGTGPYGDYVLDDTQPRGSSDFGSSQDNCRPASSHLAWLNAALGWPHAHYRIRSGPDGADLALLDVLRHEDVARRFTHVAIGSGDHLFAEEAARLAAQGVWVTVVSRRGGLSSWLERAASEVIFLDTVGEAA
jgi:hypothetical protein